MAEFLSEEDIRKLTGRIRRSKQMEELDRKGIPYDTNARGELVVRKDYQKPLSEFELGPVS